MHSCTCTNSHWLLVENSPGENVLQSSRLSCCTQLCDCRGLWKPEKAKQSQFSSVQLLSHVRLFATPGTAASVMSSNHFTLSPPFSPTFNLSQHQGLFNESVLHIRWPKFWSFNFSNSSSNEYSGLIILKDGLAGSPCGPRDSQESSPTPQFKSISSSALSFLYSPTLTSIHDYWKTIALTRWTFVGKVMSLFFNILSRFLI